jgi:N-acetylglucosaminyldiphosphoundecaprenol N-acetyl-beta-D-mannosaminyltransferase
MSIEVGARPEAASVELLGVRFLAWTEQEVVDHVLRSLRGTKLRRGGWIVTPNIDILRKLTADPDLRELVGDAAVMVPDGMPLLWAAALQGTPLPERVTGASLLGTLCAAAAADDRSVYLLGGAEGVAEAAASRLAAKHPGLRVSGWSPPFGAEATAEGIAEMRSRIRGYAADVVFCGFGFPKQERVIAALIGDCPDVWFVGCGASLTFAAGRIPRAPRWMQRCGLEWVHRLYREPRRMFRRYIVEDLPFAFRLLARAARRRSSVASRDRTASAS